MILTHVEQIKSHFGFANLYDVPFFRNLGDTAVTFFFVLSGFLITYLLLIEKEKYSISVSKFYLRRVLRIWPLYFIILISAFLILPLIDGLYPRVYIESYTVNYWSKLGLFIVFLPNLALTLMAGVPYAAHLWSIGVEEQFYLIWPLLVKHIRNIIFILFCIVGAFIVVRNGSYVIANSVSQEYRQMFVHIGLFLDITRIGSMAIGGLGACAIHFSHVRVYKPFFSKSAQILNVVLIIALLVSGWHVPFVHSEIYSLLFLVIILNAAANKYSLLILSGRNIRFLGNISYGIYMYHPMVIGLSIGLLSGILGLDLNELAPSLLLYTVVFTLTIAVASLSYVGIEKRFLMLKSRFQKVSSGAIA